MYIALRCDRISSRALAGAFAEVVGFPQLNSFNSARCSSTGGDSIAACILHRGIMTLKDVLDAYGVDSMGSP